MRNRSLLLVLIACCALSAYAESSGRVPFKDGLPDFPPLKRAVPNQPRTASLPVANDGAFHFVTGLNAEGATVWWLLHKKPDGSTLQQPPMKEDAAGALTATVKFELDATSNATTLLELSVPDTGDVLLYRWLAGDAATIALGQPLADFAVTTPDDRKLSLAELKGKRSIVVLNSWATWCVPCIEELPALNRLVKKYAGRGVEFVAIMEPKDSSDLTSFLKQHPFAYRQTLATDSSRRIFGSSYPAHVVLGADGKVAYASRGGSAQVDRELSAALERLLKK